MSLWAGNNGYCNMAWTFWYNGQEQPDHMSHSSKRLHSMELLA